MSALPARLPLYASHTPLFEDLSNFLLSHRRLPKLGETRPPWSYCGLLLQYVILLSEAHPNIVDRWSYHLNILKHQALPTEPIPLLNFSTPHPTPLKAINTWVDRLAYHEGAWKGFQLFVDWLAGMLGVSTTPSTLSDSLQEYLYRTVNVGLLLEHPSDYLRAILSDNRKGSWNSHAFFPTPHALCELMFQMTLPVNEHLTKDLRTTSILDPCV